VCVDIYVICMYIVCLYFVYALHIPCICRPSSSASGSRSIRACTTRMTVLWPGKNCLENYDVLCQVTTVLNERKHVKMEARSIPDLVSLILGLTF
jgi:hypothetical protein